MKLIVKTLSGVEELLSSELRSLGATTLSHAGETVRCEADLETLYKICYCSRLAVRVLVDLGTYPCDSLPSLRGALAGVAWEEWIRPGSTVAIDHESRSSSLPDSDAVAQQLVDAVTDEMTRVAGRSAHFGPIDPDSLVSIVATDEGVHVGLDCTGEPLNHRGYRRDDVSGATDEVMAAALLDLAGWTPDQALVDPMCGTGTICIEAALKARHVPAQFFRKYSFCFESFPGHDAALWRRVREAADGAREETRLAILGGDIDTDAIDVAKLSTLEMKLADVRIVRRGIREQQRLIQDGIVLTCPPTDAEATKRGLPELYKEVAFHLSHNFPDYDVWIYSPDAEALDAIPFDADKELRVFGGYLNLYPF